MIYKLTVRFESNLTFSQVNKLGLTELFNLQELNSSNEDNDIVDSLLEIDEEGE